MSRRYDLVGAGACVPTVPSKSRLHQVLQVGITHQEESLEHIQLSLNTLADELGTAVEWLKTIVAKRPPSSLQKCPPRTSVALLKVIDDLNNLLPEIETLRKFAQNAEMEEALTEPNTPARRLVGPGVDQLDSLIGRGL